jgi:hypothetical protein
MLLSLSLLHTFANIPGAISVAVANESLPCPPTPITSLPYYSNFSFKGGFRRDYCLKLSRVWLEEHGNSTNEGCVKSLFESNDPTNPILTPLGCTQFCTNKQTWYWDAGARVNTWIVPIFLLLSNVELAPLGLPGIFFILVHTVGDPIDTLWSLMDKLFAWYRC